MRVVVVRHAEAAPGEPDELRTLTADGREHARRLGEELASEGVEAILTSPLLRARETAEAIGKGVGVEPEVDERLGPGATAAGLVASVADRTGTVVVVCHAPDCGRIVAELTNAEPPPFPPGGTAELTV